MVSNFSLKNESINSSRNIVFVSSYGSTLLKNADLWAGNGTHFTAPDHFNQIYVIQASSNNKMYPAAYALLTNKDQETYERLFDSLKDHVGSNPTQLLIDFESATYHAAVEVFPNVEVFGCLFHWKQTLLKLC